MFRSALPALKSTARFAGTSIRVRGALAIARNPKAKDRMAAIKWLGDRGWGTAPQEITITGPDGGAVVYRVVW